MESFKTRLDAECDRAVQAEVAMRADLKRLEDLYPQASRHTVAIRHSMIELLSFINSVRSTIGAARMVGDLDQVAPLPPVNEMPLFAGHRMTDEQIAITAPKQPLAEQWKEIWTGERIAKVPDAKKIQASLHRAGDHTHDSEEEAA